MDSNNDIGMAVMTLRGIKFGGIQLRGKYVVAVFALLLLLSSKLWAGPEIIANGLFTNKAMLTIDGNTRFLKAGETSPEGVKLVRSTSKQALIEIDGKPVTLKVSQRISSSFKAAERTVVNLSRGENGHFYARGAINGYPASFMVDTGATSIAMNQNHARQFGIDVSKGTASAASTAGGIVKTHMVTLQKVSVGGIIVHNVPAAVVEGDFPAQILLGNSFLSQVDMSEQAGVLVLKKKF